MALQITSKCYMAIIPSFYVLVLVRNGVTGEFENDSHKVGLGLAKLKERSHLIDTNCHDKGKDSVESHGKESPLPG